MSKTAKTAVEFAARERICQTPQTRYGTRDAEKAAAPRLIPVYARSDGGHAYFGELFRCGCVWTCPICSEIITDKRVEEVATALDRCYTLGGAAYMVTATVRHTRDQTLKGNLDGLLAAWRRVKQSRFWKNARARLGILGTIRALEPTYGRNGWHPHLHELVFFATAPDADQVAMFQNDLRTAWRAAVAREGLLTVNNHGIDVRPADRSEYIAKWGADREILKGATKGSCNQWELLRRAADSDLYKNLWLEYRAAFKGKKQLLWSPGLKRFFAIVDRTDEEIVDAPLDALVWEEVGTLPVEIFIEIARQGREAEFLETMLTAGFEEAVRRIRAGP